ncbi:MAG: hypothetical protein BGO67_08430 [Alphaproteobacteria bacterium 41-28]|nr:MAG: hypothetical protein BGO67_08430 [Alphaproteobacteria bacterium 41-28]
MQIHNESTQPSISVDDFVTIRQLTTSNPAFTEGGIRALIFRAESNGFNKCIRRIGRKILISKSAFSHWIESQNGEVR